MERLIYAMRCSKSSTATNNADGKATSNAMLHQAGSITIAMGVGGMELKLQATHAKGCLSAFCSSARAGGAQEFVKVAIIYKSYKWNIPAGSRNRIKLAADGV
jgi:hypothetical protein